MQAIVTVLHFLTLLAGGATASYWWMSRQKQGQFYLTAFRSCAALTVLLGVAAYLLKHWALN